LEVTGGVDEADDVVAFRRLETAALNHAIQIVFKIAQALDAERFIHIVEQHLHARLCGHLRDARAHLARPNHAYRTDAHSPLRLNRNPTKLCATRTTSIAPASSID